MIQEHKSLPAIILVQPQLGENIGAAARAMYNFGLDDLRLVAPRDGWPNDRAGATAAAAAQVIDTARVVATTREAVTDLTHIYALTARPRDMVKDVQTPEIAVSEAKTHIQAGQKVGFLFGPERSGLENADIALANKIVTVPVNAVCPSINLAQCVLLVAYEWARQHTPDLPVAKQPTYATSEDVHKLVDFMMAELEARNFFHPPEKKPSMQANFRNALTRLPLTEKDLQTMWGALRVLLGKFQR